MIKSNFLTAIRPAPLLVLLSVCIGPSIVGLSQPARTASPYSSPKPLPNPMVFGDGIISTGDDESHPAFTPDGRTLYFLKNTPNFSHWTIVVSRFEHGRWSAPEVAPFSGQYSDADPFITPDGQRFFFIPTRPVDGKRKEDNDIWMMEKKGAGWGAPQHLGLRSIARRMVGISSAALPFGSPLAFAAAPFVHPVADPIAQLFGVEIHAGAPTGDFEPGGEPAWPGLLFHFHFVFIIRDDLATGHRDRYERTVFGQRLEDVLDVRIEFAQPGQDFVELRDGEVGFAFPGVHPLHSRRRARGPM